MGKARRGDYSLTNNDSPAFKHTYNKEALIDFPAEQRYRQLVNHYGQEKPSDRANTLPTRSRKKREAREKEHEDKRAAAAPPPMMKVGRVIVTAPTRVWYTWNFSTARDVYQRTRGYCFDTREISVVSARDICSDSEELQKVDSFSSHLTLGLW